MYRPRPPVWEELERRYCLSAVTLSDSEWTGQANSTTATAQGPYVLNSYTSTQYVVEGTVGAADKVDYFKLYPSATGILHVSKSTLASQTKTALAWVFLDASGKKLASNTTGLTVSVVSGATYYLGISGTTTSAYYAFDVNLSPSSAPASSASNTFAGVPNERLNRIGKGMAIARWFWTPNYESAFPRAYTTNFINDSEVRAIYKLGFRHIRILLGMEMMFTPTGQYAADYNSAFSRINGYNTRDWYSSLIPTDATQLAELHNRWTIIQNTIKRLISITNAIRSPNDAPLIVSLCPYEVATTIENGPYGGDTFAGNRMTRYNNYSNWYTAFFKFLTTGNNRVTQNEAAFELMNEPDFHGHEAEFQLLQRDFIRKIRDVDPQKLYTLVAPAPSGNGSTVGDIRGLLPYTLQDADRGNIIYTMRFYDPGPFASQGARSLRIGGTSYVGWMHSMPWPSSRNAVLAQMPGYVRGQPYDSSVPGFSTFFNGYYSKYPHFYQDGYVTPQFIADRLWEYGYGVSDGDSVPYYTPGSGFNVLYLKGRARQLVDWSAANAAPVMIGEFGVNASFSSTGNPYAIGDGDVTNDDRGRYLHDLKSVIDFYKLPWLLWGYDDLNAYGLLRATNLASPIVKYHMVDLSTLRDQGRLLTRADGTLDTSRIDFDVTVALGLNTSTVAPQAYSIAVAAPTVSTETFSSRAISLTDLVSDNSNRALV